MKRKTTRILMAIIIFSALMFTVSSAAQGGLEAQAILSSLPNSSFNLELIGSNFDLSTGITTQRRSPSVAYNSVDKEYMVVWFDGRNPGDNDIFGQRVSETGALLGANISIIEAPESQTDPLVAHNGIDNEYLVAWKTQQPLFFNDVCGRRVSSTGMLLGGDFFILGDDPLAGGGGGNEFSMTYNPTANEYLVTGRGRGVRGRRVSNTGTLLGGAEIVISAACCTAPNGQVAYNPNANEYLATWRDQLETEMDLKGRRISAGGALVGDEIVISPAFPESGRPTASVAFDPTNDRYLVVFGVFQEMEILGQFVSSSGEMIGANFPIADGLANRAIPSVVYSSKDRAFLVVWREGGDIAGQLLSDNGSLIGAPLVITQGTASGNPSLAYNTEKGEFLVVWPDNRNMEQGEEDIFAQLVGLGPFKSIAIDIKPGSDPNSINLRSGGVIPVAILTTGTFDATMVAPLSVEFGPEGAWEAHGRGHIEDVDGDGDLDLVLHFYTEDTGIGCGATSASLIGETFDGQAVKGADSINTVKCE